MQLYLRYYYFFLALIIYVVYIMHLTGRMKILAGNFEWVDVCKIGFISHRDNQYATRII